MLKYVKLILNKSLRSDMKYRVGFDIGIKSVGYCVIANNYETEQPERIVDLGVRTFDANEVDKNGESTAKQRRELRGSRRRRRRKEYRFQKMKTILTHTFSLDIDNDLKKLANCDVYELRAKALDNKLTNVELSKVILNILKRRGFKSNLKEVDSNKEEGKLKQAITENQNLLIENNYRTVGEAIYRDKQFRVNLNGKTFYNVRNHDGDYKNCFNRSDLENELRTILLSQQSLGNVLINDEFITKVLNIFSAQRNFDVGPGENSPYKAGFAVGNCTFLPNEKRAPKASLSFERFNALTILNKLRINDEPLTNEQWNLLFDKINKCSNIKFSQIRKWFGLGYEKTFNLCSYYLPYKTIENLTEQQIIDKAESKDFVKFERTNAIKKALKVSSPLEHIALFDDIALMLSLCKSDVTIDEYIKNSPILQSLDQTQINDIKGLTFDKFGNLSVRAINQILPYLEQRQGYDQACASAGFNHSVKTFEKLVLIKGKAIEERLQDITAPTVKRAINQTIRILNEIIKKYGSPQFVTIELSRDFDRTPNERRMVEKNQIARYLENQNAEEIIKKFKLKPNGNDILKLRLYNEQDCKCMYSGERIDLENLFSDNYYQIDHALPISRSLDDSYTNKVLVKTSENQIKSDMTPFEYFNKYKTEQEWNEYVARVKNLKNVKKQKTLLTSKFSPEKQRDFIERNSNDTRYISRAFLNLLQDYLYTEPNKKYKRVIKCVSGGITSYLRKCWGINKIREDGDAHHCVDAAVIAVATEGQVQRITRFNQTKEKYIIKDNLIISKETGEQLDAKCVDDNAPEDLKYFGKLLIKPYENFVKELKLRSIVKYDGSNYSESEQQELRSIGYDEQEISTTKPLFISRMKSVKTTGAIHKDTMYSTKIYESEKLLIKTVKLSELKIVDKPEKERIKGDLHPEKSVKDYYRPLDDRKLYLLIKENLIKDNEYFQKTPFINKPSKNGVPGMLVKKVKVCEYKSNIALINGGAFENDKMFRIDVFKKENKYFIIPVYMKDVYAHRLPNKLIAISKPWTDLDDSYKFQFSLYQNDLIKIEWIDNAKFSKINNNEISLKSNEIELKNGLFYYNGCDISTARIELLTVDRCYSKRTGVQNLKNMEKYYVDIMGKVYRAKEETRKEI